MQKPPPLFSRMESIKVFVTPKVLRGLLVLVVLLVAPSSADRILRPAPKMGPSPLPVPAQEWTTEARGWAPIPTIFGAIPKPGPNQKRAGRCNPKAAQVEINGGCWVQTTTPRPCPDGIQWEHDDGRCYLPVAEAKPVPQSGEPQMVNVAGEP